MGWIPEVPQVKCEENTQEALLQTPAKILFETLVAEDETWEKQLEADVKAGKLEHLRKKVLEDLRTGKFIYFKTYASNGRRAL